MGWFGGKTDTPDPTSRKDRQKCWESRDAYFACLDGAKVVKPGEEGTACADVKKIYEQNCAKSWVCMPISPLLLLLTRTTRLITSTRGGYWLNSSRG